MHVRFLKLSTAGSLLLVLALAMSGCSDNADRIVGPSAVEAALVSAEPTLLVPEFVPTAACFGRSAFRTRLVVIVASHSDLLLRALRFAFDDRLGSTVLPVATLTRAAGIPGLGIPTSTPIPIPGIIDSFQEVQQTSFGGSISTDARIRPGVARRIPVLLEFGCGVRSTGVLVISADTLDRGGRRQTSEVHVRIGD